MDRPLICLTLTGKTLAEDLALVNKYRTLIDIAELRADFLDGNERLLVRRFPSMVYTRVFAHLSATQNDSNVWHRLLS